MNTFLWAFETSKRMFVMSLSHSWYLAITADDISSSDEINPNPFNMLSFLWKEYPGSLLEAALWIVAVPVMLVLLLLRLAAAAVKLVLVAAVSLLLIIGASFHAVKFGNRSLTIPENPS